MEITKTPFSRIYDNFLSRVTSEQYMEMTEADVYEQIQYLLINAIPRFKLPRFDISDYVEGEYVFLGEYRGIDGDGKYGDAYGWSGGWFNSVLTAEEINILSLAMLVEWFVQQLASTKNTQMLFSGSDFKFTSQANHMAKLKNMIENAERDLNKLEDNYHRRKNVNGKYESTFGMIMAKPSYGYTKGR